MASLKLPKDGASQKWLWNFNVDHDNFSINASRLLTDESESFIVVSLKLFFVVVNDEGSK